MNILLSKTKRSIHFFFNQLGLQDRFEEYPKLRELIRLKDEHINKTSPLPMYLRCDLLANNFTLSSLECEFDVILIEPPLEEYKRTNGIHFDRYVTWDEVNYKKSRLIFFNENK